MPAGGHLFILPTNAGEALIILAAIALGTVLPVTAVQILWVNMVTAVTLALALPFEPAESDVMGRPPRSQGERLLSPFMVWRIVFVSVLMVAAAFGLFQWERMHGAGIESARTVAVNMLVAAEIAYLLSIRSGSESALRRVARPPNRVVPAAIITVIVLQVLFTHAPAMQLFFATTAIDAKSWLRIAAAATLILLIVEAEKAVFARARTGLRASAGTGLSTRVPRIH